uniref:Vacuolar protein sorting-associated protein 26 n=2 Tax=Parascaris TaxID=6254 RepID=A0A915A9H1_PARUN
MHYLFYDGEPVSGTVNIAIKKKLDHQGIRIEFIGQIEVYYDRGNQHDFISMIKELALPGILTDSKSFHFDFQQVEKPYHLKDVIVGKIYFLLVRIKIKYMEIAIIKRETVGSAPNVFNENETIAKYEIMDGAPVRGESIPIRLFLAGYDLTPTMRDVGKKFSVRYYLNLVLVDEEDRRYFKQQEMTLWRKADRISRHTLLEESTSNVVGGSEEQKGASSAENDGIAEHGGIDSGRTDETRSAAPLGRPSQAQSVS